MTSLMVPIASLLVGGVIGFSTTTAGCEESKPARTLREGFESTTDGNPNADSEQLTSAGAKDMNQHRKAETMLETASPDTWEAASTEAKKRLHAVTQDLIKIALDEAQPVEVRRTAVFQLGKINDESALEFLIKNISLHLPMKVIKGGDSLKETPCQYVLAKSGNWRVAQLVLESLDAPKSARERIYFSFVLEGCLGPNLARAAVDERLFRTPRPISAERKQNLEAIKVHLIQR